MKPELAIRGLWVKEHYDKFEKDSSFKQNFFSGKDVNDILNGTYPSSEYYVIRQADDSGLRAKLYLESQPQSVGVYVSTDGDFFTAETPIAGLKFFSILPTESGVERLRINNNLNNPQASISA